MSRSLLGCCSDGNDKMKLLCILDAVDACHKLMKARLAWQGSGENDEARWGKSDCKSCLQTWLAATASATETKEKLFEPLPALGTELESSSKEVALAWAHKKPLILASVDEKLKVCQSGMAEASWPCDQAVGDGEWDQFFEHGKQTFLQYAGGDELRAKGRSLESELSESKGLHEMFQDSVDKELVDRVMQATKDIDALVFAVKTMKWWKTNVVNDVKGQRFAGSQKKKLMGPENAWLAERTPQALRQRLNLLAKASKA